MSDIPDVCTAHLQRVTDQAAEGPLVGYPADLWVMTVRDADGLRVQVRSGNHLVGRGVLERDAADGELDKRWAGEVEIYGCRWWCTSPRGSGILTFSGRRTPFRVAAV